MPLRTGSICRVLLRRSYNAITRPGHPDWTAYNTKWGLTIPMPPPYHLLTRGSRLAARASNRDITRSGCLIEPAIRQRFFARLRSANEDGSSLIEFAVCLPPLFIILTGMVALGVAFINYGFLNNGVSVAAQQLSISRGALAAPAYDPCALVCPVCGILGLQPNRGEPHLFHRNQWNHLFRNKLFQFLADQRSRRHSIVGAG